MIPNSTTHSKSTTLSTDMSRLCLYSWAQINLDEETDVRTQIQSLIRDVPSPWETVELISPLVEIMVVDVLQRVCLL